MGAINEIHNIIQKAPVPKARNLRRHHFTSIRAAKVFAVLQIMLGALCMLFTEQIYSIFPFILGYLMIATGICDIYRSIVTKEFQQAETKLASHGIVTLLLGCAILYHHRNADSIIGSIWGVIGLIKGTETLNLAIYKCSARTPFVGKMIHGMIELVLGILLLIDPLSAVKHHLFILGIELIAVGIQAATATKKKLHQEE